jgi:ATP-dependent helicase HrpB
MDALPVDEALPRLKEALAAGSSAVLVAPPGAGKTTRVPIALLDAPWLGNRKIVMQEPRRLAARAAARRMAATLGESVGETVGYRVRFGSKVRAHAHQARDRGCSRACLILDDPARERRRRPARRDSTTLARRLGPRARARAQQGLREDLKLLVMSASPRRRGSESCSAVRP